MMQKKRKMIAGLIAGVMIAVLSLLLFQQVCSYLVINLLYEDLGNRNWRIQLPQGYSILEISGDEIILVKDGWETTSDIVISTKIIAYCHDSQYAAFICEPKEFEEGFAINDPHVTVYLLDMNADVLLGTFEEQKFYEYCNENNILLDVEWINTSPRPSEAGYD